MLYKHIRYINAYIIHINRQADKVKKDINKQIGQETNRKLEKRLRDKRKKEITFDVERRHNTRKMKYMKILYNLFLLSMFLYICHVKEALIQHIIVLMKRRHFKANLQKCKQIFYI